MSHTNHSDTDHRSTRPAMRCLLGATMAVCLAATTGCIQRTITITTEPPGALVELNDEEVGRTPLTVPFTFYGTYDVYVEAEGYQPLRVAQVAEAPWWEAPGPDLVAEALGDNHVELKWHYVLQPRQEPDPALLLDHARQMRAMLERGSEARLPERDEAQAAEQPAAE